MKNRVIISFLFFCIGISYCEVSAQEIIAQWSDYPRDLRDIILYVSDGNHANKNKAAIQRFSDSTAIEFITSANGIIYSPSEWKNSDLKENYWMVTFSTQRTTSLRLTAKQRSSGTGPANFKVQYKIGEGSWIDTGIKTTIKEAGKLITTSNKIALPKSIENQQKVSLRWLVSDNISVDKSQIADGCTNYIDITIHGIYEEIPTLSSWQPQSNSTDWSDENNWSNGIPNTHSNIEIHSESTSYPTLKAGDSAICDTIFFRTNIPDQSGEIANSHLLQYNAAVVELLPSANKYHLIAPPLGSIYSGDFFTKASFSPDMQNVNKRNTPSVWMKLYQTENPEKLTEAQNAYWSGYFNSLDYPVAPGTGVCIWVDDNNVPTGYQTAEYMSFVFPKDSTRYAYYDENGKVSKTTGLLSREKENRFAYESLAGYNAATGCFSVPVTSDYNGNEVFESAIVGNPFMCHLNFSSFQAANSDKIEAVYRIWGEDCFDHSILYGGTDHPLDTDNRNYIAPMQAFVVIKKAEYRNLPLESLTFSPDMGEIRPKGPGLRSASLTDLKTSSGKLSKGKIRFYTEAQTITIQSSEDDPVKAVFCYNLQGQVVASKREIAESKCTIDAASFPPIVIVKAITKKNIEIRKLLLSSDF